MEASKILGEYLNFFKTNGHAQIANSSLVPENDPTTLFTSSGMQPLVPYLLGEQHPQGKRLVNAQNCFRAQDIDEIGDNRHTTFFRMLGNWSLGDYFKDEQIPWVFEFLTERLNINPEKLYVTVFEGFGNIPKDTESEEIWRRLFRSKAINPDERIFFYGVEKNWWSRSGTPDKMPVGEPGGPDSEVFYDFGDSRIHENSPFNKEECHVNCDCGRYLEIANSVFMQYKKTDDGFEELPQKNVDFGGGLERLLMATENSQDVFKTSLLNPIIKTIEVSTGREYDQYSKEMRIVTDHLIASVFIASNNIYPSNKEQGYILRRLLRRGLDNFYKLNGSDITPTVEKIVEQYQETDTILIEKYESIKNIILEEIQKYAKTLSEAKKFISKKYKKVGDELRGVLEISSDDAFLLYTTHGLSPTQIESLGFIFDRQEFAGKMVKHQNLSRAGASQKFAGGLADHQELTIKGHTATHLLHQAIRDMLGENVHQTGSNITTERVRFDFNYEKRLTDDQIRELESSVNKKISENLPVHYEIMTLKKAKELGAIGLFDEKYQNDVKIYFIGGENPNNGRETAYSAEFCGGPHVNFTGEIKKFKIIKEEGLGRNQRRLYAVVE